MLRPIPSVVSHPLPHRTGGIINDTFKELRKMGQPQTAWSFPDCRAFMDNAIEAEQGYQVTFRTKGQATNFSLRCYAARDKERLRNAKVYSGVDHPLHNSTVWHQLTFIVKETGKTILCQSCRKVLPEENHWQVVAAQGDTSLDARTLSHGPI